MGTTFRSNKNYMKIFFSIILDMTLASARPYRDYRKKYFHIIFIRPQCCSHIITIPATLFVYYRFTYNIGVKVTFQK